jgi:hypothetical protein
MKSPKQNPLGYTVALILAAIILSVLIGWISSAFLSYPVRLQ